MNILWMYFRPLNPEAGGTERVTYLISKGLSQRGHICHGMLVFSRELKTITYENQTIGNLPSFLYDRNIDVVINQMGHSTWLLEDFLKAGGKTWQERGGKIITCLHFDPQPLGLGYFYTSILDINWSVRLKKLKCLLLSFYYNKKKNREAGATFRYLYQNSNFYVVLSPQHISHIKKISGMVNCPHLAAINNPLTFDYIYPQNIVPGKKKTVITVCRMSEYDKRVRLILKAWKEIKRSNISKDWILKLVGDGPDYKAYCEIARKMKLSDYSFEGQQSPERYYQEASIFLMTSKKEGWGLTLTESLQYGVVPVVMDTSAAFHDIIDDGENGYLTPDKDIMTFANKVLLLLQSEDLRHRMALNGLKSAERFTLDKTIDKWEQLIDNLIYDNDRCQ